MTFKEKIVKLRKLKGLTQDEFASAVGVSRQAGYKWESAQSYPEVAKLLEIKMLFSISLDDLLDDSFDIPLPEKKRKRRKKKEAVEEVVYVDEDGNEIELEDGAEYEEVVYVDENGNEVNDDEE